MSGSGPVLASDLSTYARIRNAALSRFAEQGVAATSIRDVAAAAGVSPGLVQHHFETKAGLRAAVDEYVVAVATDTFRDLVPDGDSAEVWATMGDTTTRWVRDNAMALRYLGRALVDGDEAAAKVFDQLVQIARTNWLASLAASGDLRPDVDQGWAALHVVVFNLASVLLEAAISRHLPGPFFSPDQLTRWNHATTDLYRQAFSAPDEKQ